MDIDLVGSAEIAEMLGQPGTPLSRQRTYTITRSRTFPLPVAKLKQGEVWLRADVERWIQENRPPRVS
ncbi:hypothetical protein [Micromonospora sp. NBC_01813]|uniref:hypothetical protein n=1 Tax=Micromonospora sp. NBC_01813 TaxID=2975988 RepID=UPI003FA3AD15